MKAIYYENIKGNKPVKEFIADFDEKTRAKIFKNGRSQAIRLPKKYRFDTDEVYIKKNENIILLIPKDKPWETLLKSLNKFSDDFMDYSRIDYHQYIFWCCTGGGTGQT